MNKIKDKNTSSGIDSLMKLGIYYMLAQAIAIEFIPVFYVPSLKYRLDNQVNFSIWETNKLFSAINTTSLGREDVGDILSPTALNDLSVISTIMSIICISITILCIMAILIFYLKKRLIATRLGQIAQLFTVLLVALTLISAIYVNSIINITYGFENSFFNLTVFSDFLVSPYLFGLGFTSITMIFSLPALLGTGKADGNVKIPFPIIILAIILIIAFSLLFMGNRGFYFTMFAVLLSSMIPFFYAFERRKVKTRQLMLMAVMATIAALSRWMFFMFPFFKPMVSIVMIAGASMGSLAGFITGTTTIILSNIFFGQGPWTPWQMMALGLIGYISGMLFSTDPTSKPKYKKTLFDNKIFLSSMGFLLTFIVYGGIMDTFAAISVIDQISLKNFLARYISGLPVNLIHGSSTFVFLWILAKPLSKKLERIKKKYGVFLGEAGTLKVIYDERYET